MAVDVFAREHARTEEDIKRYETAGVLSLTRNELDQVLIGASERLRLELIVRAEHFGYSLDDLKAVLDRAARWRH